MRRLNQLAANLYPRWWRDRYGAEFATLLDDAPPGFAGALNICKEALLIRVTSLTWARALALPALIGLLLSVGFAYTSRAEYVSEASFRVKLSNPEIAGIFGRLPADVLSEANLQKLIDIANLYPSDRRTHSTADLAHELRNGITLTPSGKSANGDQLFVIRSTYPDPARVKSITSALVSQFVNDMLSALGRPRRNRYAEFEQIMWTHPVESIESATLPTRAEPQPRAAIMLAGATIGACLGALLLLIQRGLRDNQPPTAPLQPSAI